MSQTDAPAPRWRSLPVAAEYLDGCSETTLRRLIRSGVLTGYKMPGSRLLRVDLNQIDAAMRPVLAGAERGAA